VAGVCTRADIPDRGDSSTSNALNGIDAFSPPGMWTVGYSRAVDAASRSLAVRYDGAAWRIVGTPSPAGSRGNILYSVAYLGPAEAIAVGSYQPTASVLDLRPLAMRWNGSAWSLLSVPAVPGCTSLATLSDVTRAGTGTFMAGTCTDAAGEDVGFVLSRSAAGAWTVQVNPGDGVLPTPSDLASITFVPGSGVSAVGTSNTTLSVPDAAGITIRFDGRTWRPLEVPQAGARSTNLNAVAGIAPNAVWSVGDAIDRSAFERLTLYWNGRRYVRVEAGDERNSNSSLMGVAHDPAGFWWSVGYDSGDSVIL